MSASADMPYFIKPSQNLGTIDKSAAYEAAITAIDATLYGIDDPLVKMVTINCLLKTHLPYYYWVGFYLWKEDRLVVGPYQGTLGCLYIDLGKGVCGTAAATRKTQIVADVHQLELGSEHIACDPNSSSEIVVPVLDRAHNLIGVFDVDSTQKASFDTTDQFYLEKIMQSHFTK
ncbi:MAG: GAF domain-containing protein [Bacteroidota bacterium]